VHLAAGKDLSTLRELFEAYRTLLRQRTRLLVLAVMLSFAAALAEGVGLSLIYPLLNSIVGTGLPEGRFWKFLSDIASAISGPTIIEGLLYFVVIIFFLKAVLLAVSSAVVCLWVNKLQEDWRLTSLGHYLYGPYVAVLGERRGQIIQNVLGEPGAAASGAEQLLNFMVKCVFAAVLTATLFVLNWKMTLALLVVVLLVMMVVKPHILKPMHRLGRKRMVAKQTMTAVTAEPIFAVSTIKLLGVESDVLSRLKRPLRKFTRANVLMTVFSKIPDTFVEFIVVSAVAGVFIVLARVYGMSYQEAAPLIGSFAVVSSRLLTVLSSLLSKRLDLATVAPSIALVRRLVADGATSTAVSRGDVLPKIESDIEFHGVGFGYADNKAVFTDLSIVFPKGKMIGIVGPTGAGKSTIGNLIGRLYDPTSGKITINGRDAREYSLESLRRRLGYVEQTPAVFNGTIAENIALGAGKPTTEEIRKAAAAAGLHDFIMSLPDGYETIVHDQGSTLSGGERQRLAIARAIVRKPDVFIFDEGTSALDQKTEAAVQKSIQALAGGATVIVIAHRISTLKNADLIYEVMPGGKVVTRRFEEIAA
jgi:ABC-type multidrug transport system fused ATPase/permease subunit